jgi:tetratricopeptide (TPR) repeat protein
MRNLLLIVGCALTLGMGWTETKPPEAVERKLTALRQLTEYRLVQLADEYWHEGHHYKTMALMFVLIEYDPRDVENISGLAWLLDGYGETARAIQVYQRGIRLNPNRYDLYYDLRLRLLQQAPVRAGAALLGKGSAVRQRARLCVEDAGALLRAIGALPTVAAGVGESQAVRPQRRRGGTQHAARAPKTPRAAKRQFISHAEG